MIVTKTISWHDCSNGDNICAEIVLEIDGHTITLVDVFPVEGTECSDIDRIPDCIIETERKDIENTWQEFIDSEDLTIR